MRKESEIEVRKKIQKSELSKNTPSQKSSLFSIKKTKRLKKRHDQTKNLAISNIISRLEFKSECKKKTNTNREY